MRHSDSIASLAAALAKAQGAMTGAKTDAKNPQYNSKYATLDAVINTARASLAANELSVVQVTVCTETGMILETVLMHSSGEWISSDYPVRPMRQVKGEGWQLSEDPQSIGSALSYARRYAYSAMIGIAEDDDDGNMATGKQAQTPQQRQPQPQPQPTNGNSHTYASPEEQAVMEAPSGTASRKRTAGQGKRMYALLKEVYGKEAAADNFREFREWLKKEHGTEHTAELTEAQADEVIVGLEAVVNPSPAQIASS